MAEAPIEGNAATQAEPTTDPLLKVEHLKTYFFTRAGIARSVRNVSLHIGRGETLGIVGESGSGKSTIALSVLRLIQQPPGRYVNGTIMFDGTPILDVEEESGADHSIDDAAMRKIRGGDIAMIFQDPMTSLNPLLKVGKQMTLVIRKHMHLGHRAAEERAAEMLAQVGISSPKLRMKSYPHEFSGGMRQRVMIAMALSTNPRLLLADEPTTALDVTVQAQVLDLMHQLTHQAGSSVMLISHDLGVIAEMADRVVVVYGGVVLETGSSDDIFYRPTSPYTHELLQSTPRLDTPRREAMHVIPGAPPDPLTLGPGCPFSNRCPNVLDTCREVMPPLEPVALGALPSSADHLVACWNPVKGNVA